MMGSQETFGTPDVTSSFMKGLDIGKTMKGNVAAKKKKKKADAGEKATADPMK